MHILEIVSFLPPYGGYFAIEQAAALQHAGNRVGMLYCQQLSVRLDGLRGWLKGHGSRSICHTERDIEIHTRYFRGMPKTIKINEQRFCRIIGDMFDEYARRYGCPDVIHAQAAKWAGIAAMEISRRTGIPYFVTEHFSGAHYEADFGIGWTHDIWAKKLITDCYKGADCVIPVADELIADIARFFGRDYKTKSMSNVTDTAFYEYRGREPGKGRKFRFCCLAIANGPFFHLKGYDVLAEAVSNIQDCELHIAGRDTDTHRFATLFEKCYGGKMDREKIFIHGDLSREGVRELLYHCDALVLASRCEVQPLVVMEALSTGIPVVGTEIIPESERIMGGVLISGIGDTESLRKCMLEVMKIKPSPVFHSKVEEMSSPETVAAQLVKLFAGV